jgi:peptidoglycan LD-endopeptidase CwlK
MKLETMIREVQQALGVGVDGQAGPQTWNAIYRRIVDPGAPPLALVEPGDRTSARSEAVIATLLPRVQPYARALYHQARAQGITIEVISGLRTWAEQDALYAKGRTAPGTKVTNARGGHSNHNFGIAFDIGVFDGRRYLPRSGMYKAVGALGVGLGLEWGGDWHTFVDQPHFQLRPRWAAGLPERQMLAEMRRRVGAGEDLLA